MLQWVFKKGRLSAELIPNPSPQEIYIHVFDMLPLEDVWSFSVVSKSTRERVRNYFTECFDFNNTMQPWFSNKDAVLLRQLMERTGAVITGSTSIAFFDRKVAEITDLNIIVGIEGSMETVKWFLQRLYHSAHPFWPDIVEYIEECIPSSGDIKHYEHKTRKHMRMGALHVTGMCREYKLVGPHNAKVVITVAIYSAIDIILHSHSSEWPTMLHEHLWYFIIQP